MSAVVLSDWEEETELGVLTIASHLEDYQLAFILNKHCKICFKNNFDPINLKRKGRKLKYSIYKSIETKNTPTIYLVDNQSVQESNDKSNSTIFDLNELIQSSLVESLKKWHYLIICADAEWLCNLIDGVVLTDIIYTLMIDIKSLKPNEQSLLYSITYD